MNLLEKHQKIFVFTVVLALFNTVALAGPKGKTPPKGVKCNPENASKALTEGVFDDLIMAYLNDVNAKYPTPQNKTAKDPYQLAIEIAHSTYKNLTERKKEIEKKIIKIDEKIEKAKDTTIEFVNETNSDTIVLIRSVRHFRGVEAGSGQFFIKITAHGEKPRYGVINAHQLVENHGRLPHDATEMEIWLNESAQNAIKTMKKEKQQFEDSLITIEDQLQITGEGNIPSLIADAKDQESFFNGKRVPPNTYVFGLKLKGKTRIFLVKRDEDIENINIFDRIR